MSVARRLLKEETVECQGQMLTLTNSETDASKNDLSLSLAHSQPRCTSVLIKQGDVLHCPNAVSSSANTRSRDDILNNWWQPLDSSEQTKQITVESDEIIGDDESVKDDDVCQKLDMANIKSSYEKLNRCIEPPSTEEHQCRKLPFSDEKLRLIHKLIVRGCLELRANVCVKWDKCVVKMSGTADDVAHTDMKLHELVVGFVTAAVNVSKTVAELLLMKVGEDWLDARLEKDKLVAVFCVRDALPVIMTDRQDTLTRVKHVIESSLVTRHIQLERHHSKLLQSSVWKECVDDLESTCLLRISDRDMMLVIEGCADNAAGAADKLAKMLRENSRISHAVKLRRGLYQVMWFRSHDIQQDDRYMGGWHVVFVYKMQKLYSKDR